MLRPAAPAAATVSQAKAASVQREMEPTPSPSRHTSPTVDLDQLAEDVLPYIKRILDIEQERNAGAFS